MYARSTSVWRGASETNSAGVGRWLGTVRTRAFTGEAVDHIVEVAGRELRVRSNPSISIPEREAVVLAFTPEQSAIPGYWRIPTVSADDASLITREGTGRRGAADAPPQAAGDGR